MQGVVPMYCWQNGISLVSRLGGTIIASPDTPGNVVGHRKAKPACHEQLSHSSSTESGVVGLAAVLVMRAMS